MSLGDFKRGHSVKAPFPLGARSDVAYRNIFIFRQVASPGLSTGSKKFLRNPEAQTRTFPGTVPPKGK